MTEIEKLDLWAREVAKKLDECPIEDMEQMGQLLNETEKVRLEFVKLYNLEDKNHE
jgi:hypothetical protein